MHRTYISILILCVGVWHVDQHCQGAWECRSWPGSSDGGIQQGCWAGTTTTAEGRTATVLASAWNWATTLQVQCSLPS